ncbi:MAG TPA: hypothetical protein DCQ33_01020 [Nitrospira sp.]|jgi:hypothetical protein|nr:hypothetical protein [Nitrospira sp.]
MKHGWLSRQRSLILACALLCLSEVAVADDSPALTALKDQLAQAQAQRDIAQAKLSQSQAEQGMQSSVMDAQKAKAAAEAQTSAANQQKAAADAQASAIAAQQAAEKAKWGSVTGSGLGGDVTVNTGAGNAEATLLAAWAVKEAAGEIGKRIEVANKDKKDIVLFTGSQSPDLSHWRTFRNTLRIVSEGFDRASAAKTQADTAGKQVQKPPKAAGTESVGAAITGIGAGLDALSKIGSYFQTNYTFAGATVSNVDDDLLAVSVAGEIPSVFFPNRWTPTGGEEIAALVQPLVATRQDAATSLKDVQNQMQKYKGAAEEEKDPSNKAKLLAVASSYERAVDSYTAALKAYDDMITSLVTDKGGVALAVLVANEKWIADKMASGALGLIVRVHSAAGANYTKKNLWTFFGATPFYVMGGTVCSYVMVNGPDGRVLSAGQFPLHSGYYKVNDVEDKFKPGEKDTDDQKKIHKN